MEFQSFLLRLMSSSQQSSSDPSYEPSTSKNRSKQSNPWSTPSILKTNVPFHDIMSEELAHQLTEDDKNKALHEEYVFDAATSAILDKKWQTDEELARALQNEFNMEFDFHTKLEAAQQSKQKHGSTLFEWPRKPYEETKTADYDSEDDVESSLYSCFSNASPSVQKNQKHVDNLLQEIGMAIDGCDESFEKLSANIVRDLTQFSREANKKEMRVKDKEEKAIVDKSLSLNIRLILYKWINQKVIDKVEHIIATGKESAVLLASKMGPTDEFFAIKVYKLATHEFKNRASYVTGDYRFNTDVNRNANVIRIWAEKEFKNLKKLRENGIPCPEPIRLTKNVLLMSSIGGKNPAPQLHQLDWSKMSLEDIKELHHQVLQLMQKMYNCGLVHGDLSEYNLLLDGTEVHVVDVSQAVSTTSTPNALTLLLRDIYNTFAFFESLGSHLMTFAEALNFVTEMEYSEAPYESLKEQVETFEKRFRSMQVRTQKAHPADWELELAMADRNNRRSPSPSLQYN